MVLPEDDRWVDNVVEAVAAPEWNDHTDHEDIEGYKADVVTKSRLHAHGSHLLRELAELFKVAIWSPAHAVGLMDLNRDDAKLVVDAWQLWLDTITDDTDVHHRAGIKYLIKLASKTGILPSSLFVPGVTFGENKVLQTFGNLTDVFRATYEGTEVALKRFRVHMRNNDRLHPKFCREALIWRQLRHPNVLPFLGIDMLAFRPSCFVSVVLPWMHQGNLMDYILSSSYVPIIHHHKLTYQVARGLAYMHTFGIIHGSVHGNNVLINQTGDAQLTDFGLVNLGPVTTGQVAGNNSVIGSPRWMSPERMDLQTEADKLTPACDVWSLASLALLMYTRAEPFAHIASDHEVKMVVLSAKRPLRPSANECSGNPPSDYIWNILETCWSRKPEDRPSMRELVTLLEDESSASSPSSLTNETNVESMSTASQMHSEYLELDLQQSEDPGLINLHQQTQCQSPLPYTDNSLYDAAESPENSTVLPELLDSARAAVLNTDDSDSTHQKTKTLLDRLARENFDLVSDKLVRWINKNHIDVCIIGRFTRLVVEKAKDRPSESEVYARLCKKIMDHISPDFGDKGLRSPRGNPLTSAQIFRKYLLDHCQEDFEQTQGPASPHAKDSDNVKTITEVSSHIRGNRNSRPQEGENPLLVEEPKHRQLGLFRFLGELFKLQMLTERIMHECVKRLLTDMGHPDEATIVCLCELLTSIGKALENPRERARMDTHFSRMKHLQTSPHVSQCAKSLLSKVIELRECGWIPKNCYGVQNTTSTQRHNGGRAPKTGNITRFGQTFKSAPGPSTTFGSNTVSKPESNKREDGSLWRNPSLMKPSSLSSRSSGVAPQVTQPTSGTASYQTNNTTTVDRNSHSAFWDAPQPRRKLNLLPRSKPMIDTSPIGSLDAPEEQIKMSEQVVDQNIAQDVDEFFFVRKINEAEEYFTGLPSMHRWRLVNKLITRAIESQLEDAELVGQLFERAVDKPLASAEMFERGFMPVVEMLDDIAIDAPKAFELIAIMLKGARLDRDEKRRRRLVAKLMDDNRDKLLMFL